MSRPKVTKFDERSIESLKDAANSIIKAAELLQSNKENFQASNLSVLEAVDHVVACLKKDSAYLSRLAEICEESSPHLHRFEDE